MRKVWNKKAQTVKKGNEKTSIDNKRGCVGKVKGTNNRNGKEVFEKHGKPFIAICG